MSTVSATTVERDEQEILCADRVTQMTKTYNDIGAVTRLLEEKERDLELAAKIGQSLLEKNKFYEERNETLEELVTQANDKISQLKHDLYSREVLLKLYTETYEGGEGATPGQGNTPEEASMPLLQKKIQSLEDENLQLHLETSKLKSATDGLEDREQKLVNDCVQQLEDVHQQLELFAKELSEKSEECSNQKEEITNLLHQIIGLQKRVRTLTAENMELQKTLEAAHDSQNYLSREIGDLKEKNEELLFHLEETQEELRKFRSRERPIAQRYPLMSPLLGAGGGESLASELENSMRSEVDHPKGYSPMDRRKHTFKVFETAKAAKGASHHNSCSASMLGASEDSRSASQRSSMYFSDNESGVGEAHGSDLDSLYSGSSKLGRPGVPGSTDLQTALRRLSMRRANELNEQDYAKGEKERQEREQLRERTNSEVTEHSETESMTPGRCRTPDSQLSANSGYLSMTGSANYYRMPERLKIVKPLEGSITLRQWQRLAKPHLGGIFENKPGVQVRGEKKIKQLEPEVYTLSDYEEDDDMSVYPTRFNHSAGVYTFTDSRVQHPTEAASDTESVSTLEEEIEEVSSTTSNSTPRMAVSSKAEGSGTSTYSMSMGLASLLNERDIITPTDTGSSGARSRLEMGISQSNPSRFPSLVSETHFKPGQSSTPATLSLTTNNYRLIPSPSTHNARPLKGQGEGQSDEKVVDISRSFQSQQTTAGSHTTSWVSALANLSPGSGSLGTMSLNAGRSNNDTNALGVINKLKTTGFSLYGYLTGVGNTEGVNNAGNGDRDTNFVSQHTNNAATGVTSTSRPTSLKLSVLTAASNATVSTANVTNASLATVGGATGMTTTDSSSSQGSKLSSLFSGKSATGVIGALAKLHRDSSL
ncbi:trafficking kinesin-binding protein 1-like isoform X2 [Mya arenaria]|uniref:trafficking kinesin-binding protein 1-like isoform X2 n=1 Tax=Mya arenaria TaxID=6604 RepID=UPI0022E32929|nr:trafficking kinesin-binding protein 1-like isoform X2 [Mya arenaria]